MYNELKKEVAQKNLLLSKTGLIILTFGNLSVYDRKNGVIAIKPSGVGYDELTEESIPVLILTEMCLRATSVRHPTPKHTLKYTGISQMQTALSIPIRSLRLFLLRQGGKYRHTEQRTAIIFTVQCPVRER